MFKEFINLHLYDNKIRPIVADAWIYIFLHNGEPMVGTRLEYLQCLLLTMEPEEAIDVAKTAQTISLNICKRPVTRFAQPTQFLQSCSGKTAQRRKWAELEYPTWMLEDPRYFQLVPSPIKCNMQTFQVPTPEQTEKIINFFNDNTVFVVRHKDTDNYGTRAEIYQLLLYLYGPEYAYHLTIGALQTLVPDSAVPIIGVNDVLVRFDGQKNTRAGWRDAGVSDLDLVDVRKFQIVETENECY